MPWSWYVNIKKILFLSWLRSSICFCSNIILLFRCLLKLFMIVGTWTRTCINVPHLNQLSLRRGDKPIRVPLLRVTLPGFWGPYIFWRIESTRSWILILVYLKPHWGLPKCFLVFKFEDNSLVFRGYRWCYGLVRSCLCGAFVKFPHRSVELIALGGFVPVFSSLGFHCFLLL